MLQPGHLCLPEPCHLEYAGVSKTVYSVFIEHILSEKGKSVYLGTPQFFPFSPGWGRLQSPITHLKSYQLQEHAQISIILPILLQLHLTKDWMSQSFIITLIEQLYDLVLHCVEEIVISAFAAIDRSSLVLAYPEL